MGGGREETTTEDLGQKNQNHKNILEICQLKSKHLIKKLLRNKYCIIVLCEGNALSYSFLNAKLCPPSFYKLKPAKLERSYQEELVKIPVITLTSHILLPKQNNISLETD